MGPLQLLVRRQPTLLTNEPCRRGSGDHAIQRLNPVRIAQNLGMLFSTRIIPGPKVYHGPTGGGSGLNQCTIVSDNESLLFSTEYDCY